MQIDRAPALFLLLSALALAAAPRPAVARPAAPVAQRDTAHLATEASALPSVRSHGVETAPVVDGVLDDGIWARAEVATGFTQLRPNPGEPASQRTEVRVLHTEDAIYVSARLHDTAPDSIVAQLGRRDNMIYSDWFMVGLDSYHDRRTAFVFGVNPRGVMVDILLHDDTEEDASWDAVWDAAARRDAGGWTAELRIPLSQLRFSASQDGERAAWGVNFSRNIARLQEEVFWAPVRPDDGRMVSAFGLLHGLDGLEPSRRLEVMPYAVSSVTRAPDDADNPFYEATDPFAGFGADLKAGLGPSLTLTATINPDFGQVEADPSVVNLSAFEVFFPEQRPFFVEGTDIFRFGLGLGDGDMGNESLFYSRRIGRSPRGDVDGDYTEAPDATTILAAGKISGKTQNGWSIGVLDAVTSAEYGRWVDDGSRGETMVEPLTNYGVARVIKDFREGRSAIGGIFTATNRSLPSSGELGWLPDAAYTGGVDLRHRFLDESYQLRGALVGSHVSGSTEAISELQRSAVHLFQRPDADHLEYDPDRTSLTGLSANAELFKIKGNWRWALLGMAMTPEFEANDLGFQTNADVATGAFWTGYSVYEPGPVFRRWSIGANLWNGTTFGGERLGLGGNVNGSFQLNSFWGGYGGVNFNGSAYSTSLLRGGPAFLRPARGNFWTGFYSDERKPVQLSVNVNGNWQYETDGGRISVSPGVEVRPSDNADFYIGPSVTRNRNVLQYVDAVEVAGEDRWLLGTVDQTTVAMTARLNYTFSPTLSLQVYAQPFISAGEYSGFKVVEDARAPALDDRFNLLEGAEIRSEDQDGDLVHSVDLDTDGTADFSFDDPGFNFRQLRSNVVLRWEYRPGSAVFLVWSQGRTDSARDPFRFDDDVDALWRAEGTNVLLVKVSYWLGL